ncbi:DUF4376 domain-containing protein [Herbaspirillum sp. SJZ107]|uniref:DUF4376 domain-containing protein n=1 Tax=Herbaspirillum sp. SJZ107 TaxID=2572881 RepID=UPI00114F3501|nr:DUF4376 domain-containing protein [Herbaspirillum sp. SJZ107]TQK10260.1 uncharacterized protein DUF4376 [Herbaspirillum sp. SJZ107]
MTQFLIKRKSDGVIIGACGQPDALDAGPAAQPPDETSEHEFIPWQERIAFSAAPTSTSVLRFQEAPVWVEMAPLDELKGRKNAQINQWRSAANQSTFPFGDKLIDCDALSRSDIDAVANHIGLFGKFPDGFPMAWKTADNDYIPLPDVEAFKAMYRAMTAQGTANFDRSEALKVALGNATDAAEVAAIAW